MRLVLILLLLLAPPVWAERRVALVMAAADYLHLRPLANPGADARVMAGLLDGLGFEVTLAADPTQAGMRGALRDFVRTGQGAEVALVFYAGHGVEMAGRNFLLPVDAQAGSAEELAGSALGLSEVQQALAEIGTAGIILLDACREDPFGGPGSSAEGRGATALDAGDAPDTQPKPGLGRIGRADGLIYAFSAAPGTVAADGRGRNSPFTEALQRHFATPGVELRTALTLVQQDVYDRSRGGQLPYVESGLPQQIFLTAPGDLPERDRLLIAMADLTPDLRAEVEAVAAARDMPLAPLYAALLSADLSALSGPERSARLEEAASGYLAFKTGLAGLGGDDPAVASLRTRAEEELALGAAASARASLAEAARIDREARTALAKAGRTRSLSLAQTLLLSANAALTELRRDLAIADLSAAIALFAEYEGPDLAVTFRLDFGRALWDLGDLHRAGGDTPAALASYEQWHELARSRLNENPDDPLWQRDAMVSASKLGAILQVQGDFARAADMAMVAQVQAQALSRADPQDQNARRDLMIAWNRLGDLQLAQGDLAPAERSFTQGVAEAQGLLAAFPASREALADHASGQLQLGRVILLAGAPDRAVPHFETALQDLQALTAAGPEDPQIRRDLAMTETLLGDTRIAQGQAAQALLHFETAAEQTRALVARDPANTELQRDLAMVHSKRGDAHFALGNAEATFQAYTESLTLIEALAARDPANAQWQVDLAVSHYLLAAASSDRPFHLQQAIAILERLAADGRLPETFQGVAAAMRAEAGLGAAD